MCGLGIERPYGKRNAGAGRVGVMLHRWTDGVWTWRRNLVCTA